jgi:hypothetical protein
MEIALRKWVQHWILSHLNMYRSVAGLLEKISVHEVVSYLFLCKFFYINYLGNRRK